MDKWRKDELDNMTCGEVALQVFGAARECEEAADKRAQAYTRMAQIEKELELAKNETAEACREERYALNEHTALKKYLNDRLHYS